MEEESISKNKKSDFSSKYLKIKNVNPIFDVLFSKEEKERSKRREKKIIMKETRNENKILTSSEGENFKFKKLFKDFLHPVKTPSPGSASSISLDSRSSNTSESSGYSSGGNSPVEEEGGRINYYPNCDARVWLRSCTHPVEKPISGIQIGVIPTWLNGSLIRNGPGRIQVGKDTYNHLFDGSALLHRFHFKDGEVKYSNKFLKSSSYLRDTEAQRIVVNYFGTRAHPDPCKTILQNIASRFSFEEHFSDNAQISVYPYGDGLYALTETPYIFRIDPDSLETYEKIDMTKYLTIFSHTAHPHVDHDGCVYNIGQVKARWKFNPCYMHSFALTQNYFVIIEQPLVVSTKKVIKGIVCQESLIHALEWWNEKDASYDPSYAKMFRGRPKRWVLPLNPGVKPKEGGNILLPLNSGCVAKWSRDGKVFVEPEILATIGCEVPRINYENYNGKKYRYFYAICSDVDHPRPGTGEDDGIVVSSLLRCKGLDRQICLVILDATSFKEMGRVEFECLGPVPKCLHGWYVPEGTYKGVHSVKCKEEKLLS
ncbi:Carotenoid isomerooxygenase [Armadillidium nasatum]|uniref:Carotenoid isomerooxygenase n=1 Tax=Armadillidium nasatum TaxID=96803 RepID=A0A5N5TI18_9CRUS|nr:Carotenoid isomerooxygenase [Armadillidium nasatum]